MKEKLKISIAEFDIQWENPQANREILDEMLLGDQADLIVLPEMFNTGFSMNPDKVAEPAFGETFAWMKALAENRNCAVAGTISTRENGSFFNRFYFVTPETVRIYDKKHLFGYGSETEAYSSGNEIVSVAFQGWKFRLITCYDLRFPVWCRNTDDYDVMLCPASWPMARIKQWKALLKARAIENMAYVIGVNRTGTDGYNLAYNGNSKVFDAIGMKLNLTETETGLLTVEISKDSIKNYREKFGFLNDKDQFELT